MALSDYLSDDEFDGCLYVGMGPGSTSPNLGDNMHRVIDALLASGHVFAGLDARGGKASQIDSHNPRKIIALAFGGPEAADLIFASLKNGRAFIKSHLPALLTETDDEWSKMVSSAEALCRTTN